MDWKNLFLNRKKELSEVSSDPYTRARTEAAELYMQLSKSAARWRQISLLVVLVCGYCVLRVIEVSGSVKVVPFIVQVDRHGYTIAVKPVAPAEVGPRIVVAHIRRFIESLKTVFSDEVAQAHLIAFTSQTVPEGTDAHAAMLEYYRKNNPMEIGKERIVNVTVNSVLSLTPQTWQAEWTEECFKDGNVEWAKHYRGIFKVAVHTPDEMEKILQNPLGIFITEFTFSEVLT